MKQARLFSAYLLPVMVWCSISGTAQAQPLLATGERKTMPDEWIDKDTHHKVIRLTRLAGENAGFYFHNNPFVGNKMVFYNTGQNGRQLYTVDLTTLQVQPITHRQAPMHGEIVLADKQTVFYQVKDSVFTRSLVTGQEKCLFVFPENFKADITTVNADGTLLAGSCATPEEKEIFRQHPGKHDFFNRIYEAKLPHTLFTINTATGELKKIFTDSAWLNHVQFSPTDPSLLMFCHEGPWHKVDRIWTINVSNGAIKLMHHRSMDMEIAGHEWFSPDGNTIWFDLQQPRSVHFFVAGTDVHTGTETKYSLTRDEWSVHYTISPDQRLFAGDGGDAGQVAKANNGQWIYLFRPSGNSFISEKLVNMQHHHYKLEPNVHFSPDGKWVVFRANFEGHEEVYAVAVEKA